MTVGSGRREPEAACARRGGAAHSRRALPQSGAWWAPQQLTRSVQYSPGGLVLTPQCPRVGASGPPSVSVSVTLVLQTLQSLSEMKCVSVLLSET